MRRLFALVVAAALNAASVPAEAGMAARAMPGAAAPRFARGAPIVMAAGTPRVTAGLLSANVRTLTLGASALTNPAPRLIMTAAPVSIAESAALAKSDAAARLAFSPRVAAPLAAAPEAAHGAAPSGAFSVLAAISEPDSAHSIADPAFDGSRLRAAADAPRASASPRVSRESPLRHPSPRRPPPARYAPTFPRAVQDGIGLTALSAPFFWALWGAIPWTHAPVLAIASGSLAVGAVLTMDAARRLWRLARRLAGKPVSPPAPVSGAKRRLALLTGAVLGLGMYSAALTFEAPLIERYHAVMDSRTEESARQHVRLVRGDAFSEETVRLLSENAVGRRILDDLRDRGGVLRVPNYFVSRSDGGIMAVHNPLFNGVYIDEDLVKRLGVTVEEFVSDPAVQRRLAVILQSTIAHELTHATQARRSLLEPGVFALAMEHEYEAYVNELFYAHEALKADPSASITDDDMANYLQSLADLHAYLRGIDERDAYRNNVHIDGERWRAWRADLEARWPAHRVEAYHLLALRELAAGHPRDADRYQQRALEAAEAADLPAPPPLPKR